MKKLFFIVVIICITLFSNIKIYAQELTNSRHYFFTQIINNIDTDDSIIKPYYLDYVIKNSDIKLRNERKLLSVSANNSNLNELAYMVGVPVVVSGPYIGKSDSVVPLDTLPKRLKYPIYRTYENDHLVSSPLTGVWTPMRKLQYKLRNKYGLYTRLVGYMYSGYAPQSKKTNESYAGMIAGEIYSSWLLNNDEKYGGITHLSLEVGYKFNLNNDSPDLGEAIGSNISSNLTLSPTEAIIGDIFLSKGFFNNKLILNVGRLTSWYFYGYNIYTDDELSRNMNSMLNGGNALPNGGGNATKPGLAIQYFMNKNINFNFAFNNPEGKDSDFDFTIYNHQHQFISFESNYVYRNKDDLLTKFSGGVHYGKGLKDNKLNEGFGFSLAFQTELSKPIYTPYIGLYARILYSEPNISKVTQEYSVGMTVEHFLHVRDSSLGFGGGMSVPSITAFSEEWFTDTYYRFYLTENSHLTFDLQLFLNSDNSDEYNTDFVKPVLNFRYCFVL